MCVAGGMVSRFLGFTLEHGELYHHTRKCSMYVSSGDIDIFMSEAVFPFFVSNVKRINPLVHLVR